MEFIKEFASYVTKYASRYNIRVHSPIIAQGILESAKGTSELAVQAKNFLGLKYNPGNPNRCPTAIGYYVKDGSEQNEDGSYTGSTMLWQKFNSMEECVIGYFDFISVSRYSALKGVTDPRTYLEEIKKAGYATSLEYVENLMEVIEKYDLTKYDNITEEGEKKMRINVHAGHNPDGKIGCGAIGILRESTENRNVKNEVIRLLRAMGHEVHDCTVENGTSASNVLTNIVKKCNAHEVDLDVSIHFNSCVGDYAGNGKTTGTEVYVHNSSSKAKPYAQKVCAAISELGFKNRGVKVNSNLYVLKKTNAPAMLIECCFVDDKDDALLYDYKSMAEAIVYGIIGQRYEEPANSDNDVEASEPGADSATGDANTIYRVVVMEQKGAFHVKENAERLKEQLTKAGFEAVIVNA